MKYRIGRQEDVPKILELAKSKGLPVPNIAACFVAEKDGEIIAYVNSGTVNFIDSIVSNNSFAGVYLMAMIEGAMQVGGFPTTFAGTINDKAGDMLIRLGYEEIKNTRFFVKKS